ncbi:gamma-interferon-inducible-lysosomal thiol reductase-like isoform X2 [Anopheles albimanus]|uniref:gamma-interferon-inducible-lysosomal thiol reductase-like isoform X2 n=1 Tax=Anopheles albimanus TaxID=7167 RepID=UPI001641FACF|nr:gamma-interferon-inducible-lysosomal thiol reductase-like isoform X2 [Anopheles albimanus]
MIRKLVEFELLDLLKVICVGAVLVTYSNRAAASDSNAPTGSNETSKLPITIYYETLCSDSMVFITHQLYPSWLRREKEMKLRLVPFGKSWCIEGHTDKKESIKSCSKGQLGATLYKSFANQTDSVHRPLPFVPTIVDDEPYNYYEQDNWLHHFDRKFVERYEAKYGTKL